jgi:hypothetical protein
MSQYEERQIVAQAYTKSEILAAERLTLTVYLRRLIHVKISGMSRKRFSDAQLWHRATILIEALLA